MSDLSLSRRPRARAWYGPAPMVVALVGWALLLGIWRAGVEPLMPAPIEKFDPAPQRFVDLPDAIAPLYLTGRAQPEGLLVVGDSRTRAAVSLRVFERHGVAPAALLWNGLVQFDHVLAGARTLPSRRLLVCLSPAFVHARELPNMALVLEQERGKKLTERVDARLGDELRVLRHRIVRPLLPATWGPDTGRSRIDPDAQTGIYRALLSPPTRSARQHRLWELRRELERLEESGWRIACVRLPVSPSVRAVEEQAFPGIRFRRMCTDLGIPYLDLHGEEYGTRDGSHLQGGEADRVSAEIARWLAGLPDFLAR